MIRWFDLVRWLPIVGGSKTSSTHLTKQSSLNICIILSSSFTKQKQAAKYKMNQQRQKCI